MKLPRGVPAERLINALEAVGYVVIRQKGSHVRMRHQGPPTHTITVPLHNPLPAPFTEFSPRLRSCARLRSTRSLNGFAPAAIEHGTFSVKVSVLPPDHPVACHT
jgi:predicted RNA binding protein YcfA (HicA-like mRNA interferase family)